MRSSSEVAPPPSDVSRCLPENMIQCYRLLREYKGTQSLVFRELSCRRAVAVCSGIRNFFLSHSFNEFNQLANHDRTIEAPILRQSRDGQSIFWTGRVDSTLHIQKMDCSGPHWQWMQRRPATIASLCHITPTPFLAIG